MVVYKIVGVLVGLNMLQATVLNYYSSIVSENMAKEKVVPEIIPLAPPEFLTVQYPSGVQVNLGNELTPTQAKDQPHVEWNAQFNAFYTLCMIDGDSANPHNAALTKWQHWLVGNIPGFEVTEGEVLSKYIGPFPVRESGLHRYVFLLFQQPRKLEFDEPHRNNDSMLGRSGFSVMQFAEKYRLGNPLAGNFFVAKWDDYVPTLYDKLDIQHQGMQ